MKLTLNIPKFNPNLKYFRAEVFIILLVTVILGFYTKGYLENPTSDELVTPKWSTNGPLQLSPDRGRFALLYSIAEDKSFIFSLPIARLATPDLGYINGNYVSLFAPGVSFVLIPGYLIGKILGASQIGAFVTISIFAVLNFSLIYAIARNLGFRRGVSLFGATVFLFATPAFAYSVNLYQHHISTFLILLSLYLLMRASSFFSLFGIFALCALSIPVDYPNLFMMAPIGIAAAIKALIFTHDRKGLIIGVNLLKTLGFLGVLPGLLFFFWFNYQSYGNILQFSGTVPSVKEIDDLGNPVAPKVLNEDEAKEFNNPNEQDKDAVGFFDTRDMLNGLYTHFISPDRGIIYYTPIILLSVLGLFVAVRENKYWALLLTSILCLNIVLYSMWGDPWGGWAFGSRYLIPGYAVGTLLILFVLNKYYNKIYLLLPLFILFSYSVYVNSLGAITSIANPPQPEVLSLEAQTGKVQKYTFERNYDQVAANLTNSVVYSSLLSSKIPLELYNNILVGVIVVMGLSVLVLDYKKEKI
jgi:hypothetical protein